MYSNFSILKDSLIATALTGHVSNPEWSEGFKTNARLYLIE